MLYLNMILGVAGIHSPESERLEREYDKSRPSYTEVNGAWS
jgi:hypothetical protein